MTISQHLLTVINAYAKEKKDSGRLVGFLEASFCGF
jgi:hypothetical protein